MTGEICFPLEMISSAAHLERTSFESAPPNLFQQTLFPASLLFEADSIIQF